MPGKEAIIKINFNTAGQQVKCAEGQRHVQRHFDSFKMNLE